MECDLFLTIMTRCYKRPTLLLESLASAYRQDDKDFDHVIMVDEVGIGVPKANRLFNANKERIHGQYVLNMDDDDRFATDLAISTLRKTCEESGQLPDMVIFQCHHRGLGLLPNTEFFQEKRKPPSGRLGSCSFITRHDIYKVAIEHFGGRLGGDYEFFEAVYSLSKHIVFLEQQLTEVQIISHGRPE